MVSDTSQWRAALLRMGRFVPLMIALVVLGLIAPRGLQAQTTCNGTIEISYVSTDSPNVVGSVDRVRLRFGAGGISGGTTLTLSNVFFDLDCKAGMAGCVDEGAVVSYKGDSTITTTCANVSFSSNNPMGGAGTNEIVFTANPSIDIPANTFPYCEIQFDIQILSLSTDSTPNSIEERAGFATASCNNSGTASQIGTGSVPAEQKQCAGVTGVLRSLPRR